MVRNLLCASHDSPGVLSELLPRAYLMARFPQQTLLKRPHNSYSVLPQLHPSVYLPIRYSKPANDFLPPYLSDTKSRHFFYFSKTSSRHASPSFLPPSHRLPLLHPLLHLSQQCQHQPPSNSRPPTPCPSSRRCPRPSDSQAGSGRHSRRPGRLTPETVCTSIRRPFHENGGRLGQTSGLLGLSNVD